MKITLDTEKKEITLGGDVDLDTFITAIKGLLPDGAWKEYKLITNTTVTYWQNPIYVPYHGLRPYWDYGPIWAQSQTTGEVTYDGSVTLATSVYSTATTMCFEVGED